MPRLEELPLQELPWERFEQLLRRMTRDVLGLRQVQLYGARGQSQHGIDIVGRSADGTGEAIQSKKYETFTKADLTAAVAKFLASRSTIPFPVGRVIIAAACHADRREITDELYRLDTATHDLDIELWERRSICDSLRERRDIVVEFFGPQVADAFCLPGPSHVVPAPPPDKVMLADALLHGPAITTGAEAHLTDVARLESDEPARAAQELERAERLLIDGGFAAHAAVLAPRRADLLSRAGQHDEAIELLSERFWQALDAHEVYEPETLLQSMMPNCVSERGKLVGIIAEHALEIVRQPLEMPQVDLDEVTGGSVQIESARFLLLMAETAAVEPGSTWTVENAQRLLDVADAVEPAQPGEHQDALRLAYRLRIEVAHAIGEWTSLLSVARRHRVPRCVAALILARYALHQAERGEFDDPDEAWEDATEQACLDGRGDEAAEWVHARHILRSRLRRCTPELEDFPRLVRALRATGAGTATRLRARLEERALRALNDHKPHTAVPALRAWLRVAHASGVWGDVLDVRALLAGAYREVGELDHAAALLAQTGNSKKAKELAKAAGDRYLDVRSYLEPTAAYWVPATAFHVVATQADLVPDDHVNDIVAAALDVVHRRQAGTLRDMPFLSPSVHLAAVEALAALSDRLPEDAAHEVLRHLRPYVPREPNHYHHTDDSHVRACVGITGAHPTLRGEAIDQLLDLLAAADSGVSQRVESQAGNLFVRYMDLVGDRLKALSAAGNTYAAAVLAWAGGPPDDEQLGKARAAAIALSTPTTNTANSIGMGTDAVRQSLLARHLPTEERKELVRVQLEQAASPFEPGSNRIKYYTAAANLAHDLEDVDDLFEQALARADDAAPSPGDLMINMGNHPLSTFRINGMISDTRPQALLLAAVLARSPAQRAQVRSRAISLLGVDGAGWHVVRALRIIAPADLVRDVPLLATQQNWAARSLAALTWAASSPDDPAIGLLLAGDPDPRVRRALAHALRDSTHTAASTQVKDVMRTDKRYSIRSVLLLADC